MRIAVLYINTGFYLSIKKYRPGAAIYKISFFEGPKYVVPSSINGKFSLITLSNTLRVVS